jgi:acyl-CoA thioester hydrolase
VPRPGFEDFAQRRAQDVVESPYDCHCHATRGATARRLTTEALLTAHPFHLSVPVKVRFRDIDAFGHVNNAVYFTYMEVARVEYITRLGLRTSDLPRPFFIIAAASCQYKVPIQLTTALAVQVRVSRLGASSFDMEYHMIDETTGQLLATGHTTQVVFDYVVQRSVPMPDEWRKIFTDFEGR